MKIEFYAIKNTLITNFFSLPMNQLKIDAKVIDALNEQLGSIANALRMATTAQEIKDDVGGDCIQETDELGEDGESEKQQNQLKTVNPNKVIVQCADAEEVVLNANVFNSAELIKFISENYSNITIKLDKHGSDAFKKIVIDNALRDSPYSAPIEIKEERWTHNITKSCTVRIIEINCNSRGGLEHVIFQLIPKVSVKYAHMLIFKLKNISSDTDNAALSHLQNYINHVGNMAHYTADTRHKVEFLKKEDDLSAKILMMLNGYYRSVLMNSIIHLEKNCKKSFKFDGWYYNYARNVDVIILFEEHRDLKPTNFIHYVLFSIKPRYNVHYLEYLTYLIQWDSAQNSFDYIGIQHSKSTTTVEMNKLFKFSDDSMDMIRQFISVFEFDLTCRAKQAEWNWNANNCR